MVEEVVITEAKNNDNDEENEDLACEKNNSCEILV